MAVGAVADDQGRRSQAHRLRDAWVELYGPMLADIEPFNGARELLEDPPPRLKLVLTSSGKKCQVEPYSTSSTAGAWRRHGRPPTAVDDRQFGTLSARHVVRSAEPALPSCELEITEILARHTAAVTAAIVPTASSTTVVRSRGSPV